MASHPLFCNLLNPRFSSLIDDLARTFDNGFMDSDESAFLDTSKLISDLFATKLLMIGINPLFPKLTYDRFKIDKIELCDMMYEIKKPPADPNVFRVPPSTVDISKL